MPASRQLVRSAMPVVVFVFALAVSAADLPPDFIEGIFGPTNINGAVGNGRLTAGIAADGTVTVLKWPRPSYHDQVRYRTYSRDLPRMGARENDGIFFGLVFDDPAHVVWLRNASSIKQGYFGQDTNVLMTAHDFPDLGIAVFVYDFAPPENDALVRRVTVQANEAADRPAAVLAYINLALHQQKIPYAPVADVYLDPLAQGRLAYHSSVNMLIQTPLKVVASGDPVAAALGFFDGGASIQCGLDGQEGDAYADSADGFLSGKRLAEGSVNAALTAELEYDEEDAAEASLFIAFAPSEIEGLGEAERLRERGASSLMNETASSDRSLLAQACLPDAPDSETIAVARRALLTAAVVRDQRSGALGCSVATQPAYAPDWPRDGAYTNLMIEAAGLVEWVTVHNAFYLSVQREPLGNWDMCVYGDGTPAGPLFLESDNIALTAWNLWRHAGTLTGEDGDAHRALAYAAVRKVADFFVWWRDPETLLPLPAFESDFLIPKSTLLSAEMAWLALRIGIEAGATMGESADRLAVWMIRQDELTTAIWEHYYNPVADSFEGDAYTLGYLIWPVEFLPLDHPTTMSIADEIFGFLTPIMRGETAGGSYIGLLALPLAIVWRDRPERRADLEWILDFLTYDLPTQGTRHYGECFVTQDGRFEVRTGIPHPMTAAFTYLLAAELYGLNCPDDDDDEPLDDDEDDAPDDTDEDDEGCSC